jgi:hypothetical protein
LTQRVRRRHVGAGSARFAPMTAGCKAGLRRYSAPTFSFGGMAEWLKAHAWKACIRETVSWVRIPLPPPEIGFAAVRCRPRSFNKILELLFFAAIIAFAGIHGWSSKFADFLWDILWDLADTFVERIRRHENSQMRIVGTPVSMADMPRRERLGAENTTTDGAQDCTH